ncbi:MAG TPA: hypothetical protein VE291_01580 [Terracidiphilus sp.]|nr:hypothetical protein [Terracidiphilus sp.]
MMTTAVSVGLAQSGPSASRTRNEVGLVIGATVTPSIGLEGGGNVDLNPSLALGAEYDRLLLGRHTALYGGVDFLLSPLDVKANLPASNVSPQYASLFLTPHVRVKFNATGTFQPWLLFGGGYANFSPTQPRTGGVNVTGQGSSGTLEFGGGVDTRPLVHLKGIPIIGTLPIGARFEVRDFYSGQPRYGVPTNGSLQNNVAFTGGLVLHF